MEAYLQPLVSCHLYTAIIRQKKKNLEKSKILKDIVKIIFTLELRIILVYVCGGYIFIMLYVVVYVCVCVCVCVMIRAPHGRFEVV